jgi:hypothetical protein
MLSGPCALYGLRFFSSFIIPFVVILNRFIVWCLMLGSIKEKYKQLKHHTQKITRQSYWKYIENIVTPKEEEPYSGMKKFWKFFFVECVLLQILLLFLWRHSTYWLLGSHCPWTYLIRCVWCFSGLSSFHIS